MVHRFGSALLLLLALTLGACGAAGGIVDDFVDDVTPGDTLPPPPTEPPPGDPPPADPPPTSMSDEELAKAHVCLDLVNDERAAAGLPPIAWADDVAEVAYHHSYDMDQRDYFSHTNPDGLGPGGRLSAAGVSYSSAGENIFWASWHASAAEAMEAWMNSSGHRANILRTGWTEMGIGVHQGAGGSWWTQVFVTR